MSKQPELPDDRAYAQPSPEALAGSLQVLWPPMLAAGCCFALATAFSQALLASIRVAGPLGNSGAWVVPLFRQMDRLACRYLEHGSTASWGVPLVVLVMPLFAGLLAGILARGPHALGTFCALSLLIPLASGLRSFLPVPQAEVGPELTLIQLVSWLPVGCAAAPLGGWLRERWRWSRRHCAFP